MKTVICSICGKSFETSKPNKKYCGFTCKEAAIKIRRFAWEKENPDYIKNYMRKYRKAQKEKIKEE